VVENIFIENIYMKDIPGDAILFDMYYMGKDPVPMAGETRALPKVEMKPVDETTPVFKNFYISKVYCSGADKGIYIRGLPEMHVKDIVLENMVLQAKKGFDIQEASGITFRNITILSKETDPVIDIVHSDKLVFDNVGFSSGAKTYYRVAGDRSGSIKIINSPQKDLKANIKFELGAQEKILSIQ
jgi:hypothetical protein